jgi:hypothetical protein
MGKDKGQSMGMNYTRAKGRKYGNDMSRNDKSKEERRFWS